MVKIQVDEPEESNMPRPKIFASRLHLNLTSDQVEAMQRIKAERERAGQPSSPAELYREAMSIGFDVMLNKRSDELGQLEAMNEALQQLRDHARPVGRFLTRLEEGVEVLERLQGAGGALAILERLAEQDDGIEALERLADRGA